MTTHTEDVRRLESEFAAAMAQMYAVGNGLARLRAQLEREGATVASPAPSSLPAPAVPTPAQPRVVPPPPRTPGQGSPLSPMAPVQTAPSREPWWQRTSLVSLLIGGAGALVTLLGVVFLIQLAIAVGIFGPLPRVIAGALVAVALAVAAALVRRRNHTGSLALAATSVAAAYLDIMGATLTYHFLPDVVGLALATLVGALGLSVARWWRSEFLGCVAVLGVALLNLREAHDFLASAVYGLGAGLGFSLVLILFAGIRERLAAADVPVAFQGAPVGLITAGVMALAFMGFGGLA